ncbi:hypothetical protein ACX3YC_00495 [Pseudomonas mohnii]|jgi:hypothetical protein|uniref:hypothetical protein n=1 Tax=unclassified Pseudomonas TaxID=196821 RepID=UPI00102A7128|nr:MULTISPECIES: hypothetical protein [unclassified Pseudomonas]MBM6445074.1 hypothetical protein [Pseudomonas sp. MIL9]RZO08299.1 hypothetical protein EKG40_12000 [Pseudomonas moorei]
MLKKIIVSIAFISAPAWAAQPPFTGTDYSGHYVCTGKDSHIGDYEGVVDLKLNPEQSTGEYGAYNFTLTLADNARYNGFAAAHLNSLAIYFAYTDPAPKDYGVGIAKVVSTPEGKVSFTKYYYAPQYQGGGHGMETCVKH